MPADLTAPTFCAPAATPAPPPTKPPPRPRPPDGRTPDYGARRRPGIRTRVAPWRDAAVKLITVAIDPNPGRRDGHDRGPWRHRASRSAPSPLTRSFFPRPSSGRVRNPAEGGQHDHDRPHHPTVRGPCTRRGPGQPAAADRGHALAAQGTGRRPVAGRATGDDPGSGFLLGRRL